MSDATHNPNQDNLDRHLGNLDDHFEATFAADVEDPSAHRSLPDRTRAPDAARGPDRRPERRTGPGQGQRQGRSRLGAAIRSRSRRAGAQHFRRHAPHNDVATHGNLTGLRRGSGPTPAPARCWKRRFHPARGNAHRLLDRERLRNARRAGGNAVSTRPLPRGTSTPPQPAPMPLR